MNDRYYEDVWQGSKVKLDREYRGHYLSTRECAALFRGRSIEIHGLRRGHTTYSIECRLEADPVLDGVVNIKSLGTVGENPDYRLDRETSPFRPHGLSEDVVDAIGVDSALLDSETQAMILDESRGRHDEYQAPYVIWPEGYDPDREDRLKALAELSKQTASSWRKALGLVPG